jgi:hypothetical protein
MFKRLKQAMVESFVGAIALGYLLAQAILHFVNIFSSPVGSWITRREYRGMFTGTTALPGFSLQDALPELIRFVVLIMVWYALLRWLYVKPMQEPAPNPEQTT